MSFLPKLLQDILFERSQKNYDICFERVVGHEGKYSADSKDRGNWTGGKVNVGELKGTKYGISAAAYPNLDIKNLTLEQAKVIYLKDYWNAIPAANLPLSTAYQLFDASVNHGVNSAIRMLQRSLSVKDDGDFGKASYTAWLNHSSELQLGITFLKERQLLNTKSNSWDSQGKGWTNRASLNMDYLCKDAKN